MAPAAVHPSVATHADPANPESQRNFDILIVGGGISGINAAYRVQTELPNYSFAVLEARDGMGGTWDLFKYPGIRSDSDLHTFGFSWEPWTSPKTIADGSEILSYMKGCAAKYNLDRHFRYRHRLVHSDWRSDEQMWNLKVQLNNSDAPEDTVTYRSRFILISTGYYNYNEPLQAQIPGIETFKGKRIHPQFWPTDFDYTGKKMVVIGSGATAVTLIPSLAEKASHVTMLQRSPGYLINLPRVDHSISFLQKFLPKSWVFGFTRLRWLVVPLLFFNFCRSYPKVARSALRRRIGQMLPKNLSMDPHFSPAYNPWEQRLCVTPDGDLFDALGTDKADIVTGTIQTVTPTGILVNGMQKEIAADVIVTATGLKIQTGGGATFSIDGKPFLIADKFLWNGMLLSDVPNFAYTVGYTNASWTLGADATAQGFVRLVKIMESKGYTNMTPRVPADKPLNAQPLVDFNSTYFKVGGSRMPMGGDRAPWRPRANYFSDMWAVTWGAKEEDLHFETVKTT